MDSHDMEFFKDVMKMMGLEIKDSLFRPWTTDQIEKARNIIHAQILSYYRFLYPGRDFIVDMNYLPEFHSFDVRIRSVKPFKFTFLPDEMDPEKRDVNIGGKKT